jgi:hypothetical protein
MKKLLKKALIWFPILFVGSIIGLEAYTRTCNCNAPKIEPANLPIPICESESDAYPFSYDAEQRQMIDEIIEKRSNGETVTREVYREAINLLVFEAPLEELGVANGVVCRGGVAFVRDSLPTQAELFVKRHELEHLFQKNSENQEVKANIAAGKEYPLGLLSTIVLSLIEAKSKLSWCCFLKSSWFIFKIYFLGIDGAKLYP